MSKLCTRSKDALIETSACECMWYNSFVLYNDKIKIMVTVLHNKETK